MLRFAGLVAGVAGCFTGGGGGNWATTPKEGPLENKAKETNPLEKTTTANEERRAIDDVDMPAPPSKPSVPDPGPATAEQRKKLHTCMADAVGTWNVLTHMPEGDAVFVLHLYADGTTAQHSYQHVDGSVPYPEYRIWKEDYFTANASGVEWTMNGKYTTYSGPCPSGDRMTGDVVNVNQLRWKWEAKRKR